MLRVATLRETINQSIDVTGRYMIEVLFVGIKYDMQ